MARIDGIADAAANLVTHQVYKAAKKRAGMVPDPLRLYAHCPPVMLGVGAFEFLWAKATSVDPVLKDLCQLKVSAMVGCLF